MTHPLHVPLAALALLALPALVASAEEPAAKPVQVLKAPDGGIQPQAAIDEAGTVHLVSFKGDPAAGDLFYARLEPGKEAFSTPVRVNSEPGSAVAMGTIRGAQLALGRGGRVHVAWNGSDKARPKNAFGSTPMLYARSDEEGKRFEPERNVMLRTSALDGGGSLAADGEGNVYVAWHARSEDSGEGEDGRRMWVARSQDDGASFTPEAPAFQKETGACGCCGTKALADRRGTVYLLYRAATRGVDRDMYLLRSGDHGAHFAGAMIHPWKLSACPMSSASLADDGRGLLAAWETDQQVYFARVDRRTGKFSPPISPPGGKGRKHPAVAGNAAGKTLLVWAEGTGWQKGGSLAWQEFDKTGRPSGAEGRIDGGVPTWGLPAVVARSDGSFLVVH